MGFPRRMPQEDEFISFFSCAAGDTREPVERVGHRCPGSEGGGFCTPARPLLPSVRGWLPCGPPRQGQWEATHHLSLYGILRFWLVDYKYQPSCKPCAGGTSVSDLFQIAQLLICSSGLHSRPPQPWHGPHPPGTLPLPAVACGRSNPGGEPTLGGADPVGL